MSGYIILGGVALGLSALPDVIVAIRARREDLPAVMAARSKRKRARHREDNQL